MKLLVLGPSCSGKMTVCRHLRRERETNAIDACDEILRLNDGVWPDIGRKNDVLLHQVVEHVAAMDDVVLFNSYMHRPLLERLRAAGFQTVLPHVAEMELRRRHQVRQATQGWTNVQWLEWDLDHLKTLQAGGLIDEVVSGEQDAASIAAQILAFAQRSDFTSTKNQAVEAFDSLGIAYTGLITLKDVDERQNGNWLVDTVDGERQVLRRYHDRATSTDIGYEHAVLCHLAAAGWVVPAPIGEAVEHRGRWFCITRHVPGAPVRDESEAQRRRRGRGMAHIDVALRVLGDQLGQRPGWRPQHTGPSVHEDVDWDQCLAVLGGQDTRLQDWAATAAAAIAAELAAIGAAALPLTLLHGDFAEWNEHYLHGELAGAIDFALSHLDSRPDELAIARTHRSPETIDAGEIGALRVKRIDFRRGRVEVAESVSDVAGQLIVGPTETCANRHVPMPPRLLDELTTYLGTRRENREELVFASPMGGPLRHGNFHKSKFKPAVRAAGLPDGLRFHDLRHTYAAFCIASTADPYAALRDEAGSVTGGRLAS